jgi:methionyl aminopeptidase
MVELKTPGEIDVMREAGRLVAQVLRACTAHATVGTSLHQLDEIAAAMLSDAGARSSFQGYLPPFAPTPYPAVICASVNDVVVHGIPNGYRLRDGDVLTLDFGAAIDGYHGDAAVSIVVGKARRQADLALVERTQEALDKAIAVAQPDNRLGDIAHVIGQLGRTSGYGIPVGFGGHGVGRRMHEDPFVPNVGRPGHGWRLQPGLVIAIEPMFIAGGRDDCTTDADGWALRASKKRRSAHAEHTIAITEDGPLVLTAL